MNTAEYLNKPLFSITVGEFLELQKRAQTPVVVDFTGKTEKYVYGIPGIAQLFGCGRRTAQNIKSSGRIDKAISQVGKIIAVNADLAMELAGKEYKSFSNRRKA